MRALARQPVDQTPVWIMRQAGRYLPEYRATRKEAGSFLDLCKNAELACEVTMQPLRRYNLDAAILFSDILTVPDAMGLGLYFVEGEGPKFERTVRSASDLNQLREIDADSDLGYVMNAVSTIRNELNGKVPLIGFSGSPWTLATYMVEGGSTRDFAAIKTLLYREPAVLHQLLSKLADAVVDYLNAQIRAGAQAVQIFDTWGGILSHSAYRDFSLQYMQRIVAGLVRENDGRPVPVILFTKNGGQWIDAIAGTGCDAIGVDWTTHLGEARAKVGDRVALQGNLDPAVLRGSDESIRHEVRLIIEQYGTGSGHIFNLGHGITPDINPDKVSVLVEAVSEHSKSM